jgi:DNA-binding PadR family transcriptional regulator
MASLNILEKLRKRAIKNFMDILILTEIENSPLSGYDVIAHIHKRFGILVSSGTVYSLLYSLEREGLIKGVWNQRKRVYELTEKGEQNIKVIRKANEEIQNFLRNISLLNATQQSPMPT